MTKVIGIRMDNGEEVSINEAINLIGSRAQNCSMVIWENDKVSWTKWTVIWSPSNVKKGRILFCSTSDSTQCEAQVERISDDRDDKRFKAAGV
jgi:hypothetical protein